MRLEDAVHDGYVCARNLVHRYVSGLVPFAGGVREEEQVAAVERGLHGATGRVKALSGHQSVYWSRSEAYLSTTTIGDSVLQMSPSPFHIMSPVASTDAKFRIWSSTCNVIVN